MIRITRRGFAALAGATVLARKALAQNGAAPLIERAIPSSGERLPPVGLGTAYVFDDDDERTRQAAAQVVRTLIEAGGRVVDTASSYGEAESVLGDVIARAALRDKLFVATKLEAPDAAELKRSLADLKTMKLDLLQLHNVRDPRQSLAQFKAWQTQGLCRYIGITSTFHGDFAAVEAVLGRERPDFVQIDYSLDDREAEKRILPLAAEVKAGVLTALLLRARSPVPRGARPGDPRLGDWFRRQLGAVLPQVSARRRTCDCGHSRHFRPGAHGGQSRRHAGRPARSGAAQADGGLHRWPVAVIRISPGRGTGATARCAAAPRRSIVRATSPERLTGAQSW
jgi:aryl-alcohol dehydrogenase-like predicted oxidoreductase